MAKSCTDPAAAKLLLVDDHEIVRIGLRMLFNRLPEVRVVGEAASGAGAVSETTRLAPDVVLLDLRLPDMSGVEACRAIRAASPATRVLFLTSYKDDDAMLAAVMAGAGGYLLKEIDSESLVNAVKAVASGQSILDPGATRVLMERIRALSAGGTSHEDDRLSAQETRVLALIAEGKTNREIALVLGLSDKTVKNYVSRVLQKMHVQRRSQAAVGYMRRNRG